MSKSSTRNQQYSAVQLTVATIVGFLSVLISGGTFVGSATVAKGEAKQIVKLLSLLVGVGTTVILALILYVSISMAIDTASMWIYGASILLLLLIIRAMFLTVARWRALA